MSVNESDPSSSCSSNLSKADPRISWNSPSSQASCIAESVPSTKNSFTFGQDAANRAKFTFGKPTETKVKFANNPHFSNNLANGASGAYQFSPLSFGNSIDEEIRALYALREKHLLKLEAEKTEIEKIDKMIEFKNQDRIKLQQKQQVLMKINSGKSAFDDKQYELELASKELELRQKELQLKQLEFSMQQQTMLLKNNQMDHQASNIGDKFKIDQLHNSIKNLEKMVNNNNIGQSVRPTTVSVKERLNLNRNNQNVNLRDRINQRKSRFNAGIGPNLKIETGRRSNETSVFNRVKRTTRM